MYRVSSVVVRLPVSALAAQPSWSSHVFICFPSTVYSHTISGDVDGGTCKDVDGTGSKKHSKDVDGTGSKKHSKKSPKGVIKVRPA